MPGVQDEAGESLIAATPSTERAHARRRPLVILLIGVAVVTYLADQLSKIWAVWALTGEPPRDLVGSFLRLDLIRNPGAAFSLGTGSTWVLTLVAIAVLVVIVRTSRRIGSSGWAWAFGLLLGGALGNLTDRLVRDPGLGQGHVVDFLNYNGYFIGNVADIAIVAAAGLIAILAVRGIGVDGSRGASPDGRHEEHGHTPAEGERP